MKTDIPPAVRQLVETRDLQRCRRCWAVARHPHKHHRRSRSVRDAHTHCPCNLVNLCGTCHSWVHAHPFHAREEGFIVSRYRTPREVPVGDVVLACDGLTFTQ